MGLTPFEEKVAATSSSSQTDLYFRIRFFTIPQNVRPCEHFATDISFLHIDHVFDRQGIVAEATLLPYQYEKNLFANNLKLFLNEFHKGLNATAFEIQRSRQWVPNHFVQS